MDDVTLERSLLLFLHLPNRYLYEQHQRGILTTSTITPVSYFNKSILHQSPTKLRPQNLIITP